VGGYVNDNEDDGRSPHAIHERNRANLDPITVKEQQSIINFEYALGLPIGKPALHKKSLWVVHCA
jgi:Ca2+:H+ antiporter